MQQVEVGAYAQLTHAARDPGRAQVQGPLLDVLPGGEDLVGGEFAGDHAGVAGVLAERADLGLPFPGFLALADRLGVELEGQLVRGRAHLPERHPGRGPGQVLAGRGRVLVAEDAGLVLDDPQVHRVDPPGGQRGERLGQPGGGRGGVVHLPGGRQRGQVQLEGQLIGGELIRWLGAGVAAGVLGHGRHHRPLVAGGLPPGCGDNPRQLVIRTSRQAPAVLAGDGVHDGGQQRAGGHRVGLAALGEPGQGQLLRRQAHGQALPGEARIVLLPGRGRQRGAAGLLAVARRAGEQVLGHEPPSVRKNPEIPLTNSISYQRSNDESIRI